MSLLLLFGAAVAGGIGATLDQAVEDDIAFDITPSKSKTIEQAVEDDSAGDITPSKFYTIEQAVETDSAFDITGSKSKAIEQATETDTAQDITSSKSKAIEQASETDSAFDITPVLTHVVEQAIETDSAFDITFSKSKAIEQALETDSAQDITFSKSGEIAQAIETDSAFDITPSKSKVIEQAIETDTAQDITVTVLHVVEQAVETDTAFDITPSGGVPPVTVRLEGVVTEFLSQGTAAPHVRLHGIASEFLSQGTPPYVQLSGVAAEFLYELPPLPVEVTTMFEGFIGWQTGVANVTWIHQEFIGHGLSLGEVTWVHVDVLRTFEPIPPPEEECPTTPYECVVAETPPYECVQVSPFACVGVQPEVRIVVEEVCPPIEGEPLPGSETPPEEEPPAVESVTIVSPMSPIMQVGQTYMLTVQVLGVPDPEDPSQPQPLSGRTVQFVSSDISVVTVLAFATTDKNGFAIVPVIATGLGTFTVAFQCEDVTGEPLTGTVEQPPPATIDGYGSMEIGLVSAGAGSFVALQPGQGSVSIGVIAAGAGSASAPPAFGQVFIGVTAVGSGIFMPPATSPPEISGTANVTIGLVAAGAGAFTPLQSGEGAVAIGVIAAGAGTVVGPPAHGAVSIGVTAVGSATFTPAPPQPVTVTSVIVSPCPSTGSVGGSLQLSANPVDASGNHVVGVSINWVSSNPAVATVTSDDGSESHRATVRFIAVGSAIISATNTVVPTVPPVGTIASHDFEDGTLGPFGKFENNGQVTVVSAENGVTPASGTKMVRCRGNIDIAQNTCWAEVSKLMPNNPARTPKGIYMKWRMYIPQATVTASNVWPEPRSGSAPQIKLHLYRVSDEVAENHTPPAYHGLIAAIGLAANSGNEMSYLLDNLNLPIDGVNAIDDLGAWSRRCGYVPGTWVEIEEWYQTDDGVNTQYKLWLNNMLCKHQLFTPNTGGMAVIGGALTDTYKARFGIAYSVNKSSPAVANVYTVYIDKIMIRDTYIGTSF